MASGSVVTWDCVWFGSYPQTEVKPSDSVYAALGSASWDDFGDATIGGVKYRRISREDVTTGIPNNSWDYNGPNYRYFRYEPIKWRVLDVFGDTAYVVADIALDCRMYNERRSEITWQTSSVRSWLNGYNVSSNEPGINYATRNFVSTAFSSDEGEAIIASSTLGFGTDESGGDAGRRLLD